jgi:hypothetical protein
MKLNEQEKRAVEKVAQGDGRIRCRECEESKAFVSDGRSVRYKGDVRYGLFCPNGHRVNMDMPPDSAQQLGLPMPPFSPF